jgi:virginiamycin A acetyltransferase
MIGIETIRIGANSWIENAAVVMANVGAHWVVGAGSVAVSDMPDWSVVAGNPARILRVRTIEPMSPGVV